MTDERIVVGDMVMWRGAWGSELPMKAQIEAMELCANERDKYGEEVQSAWLGDKDRLCVTLTNGSWAYGFQIEPIKASA